MNTSVVTNLRRFAKELSIVGRTEQIRWTSNNEQRRKQLMSRGLPKRKSIDGVSKVVLVASGKGGVGKSTVSVNLAVGLSLEYPTKKIGLLDADVFGPSIPLMMNLKGKPDLDQRNLMIPLQNYGVKCMSMGFLVDEKSPVVWRGLMVMQAIEDLVRGVAWSPLDLLVVDMPPGTGDTQLSMAQTVLIDGAVMVTTPQKVAVQDALKGAEMFRKTNVPLLGFVLNMTGYECSSCSHFNALPSTEKAIQTVNSYDGNSSSILAQLPWKTEISECSDAGKPILISYPKTLQAEEFRKLARNVMTQLDKNNKHEERND